MRLIRLTSMTNNIFNNPCVAQVLLSLYKIVREKKQKGNQSKESVSAAAMACV